MFKAWFCKYLHICTSYKWSNCMDVRICVCVCVFVYIPIFAGRGLCSIENMLPKWSQTNLCWYFKLISFDGRWRQTAYNINFLIGSHLTKSPVTLVSHEPLFFCRYVPNKLKFWKWIFALTNIKGELKSNMLHSLLGKSAVKHCFQ